MGCSGALTLEDSNDSNDDDINNKNDSNTVATNEIISFSGQNRDIDYNISQRADISFIHMISCNIRWN
jgi:hypothetical protein